MFNDRLEGPCTPRKQPRKRIGLLGGLGILGVVLVSATLVACQPSQVGGFPTVGSTGIRPGTALKTWTGPLTTSSKALPTATIYGVKFKVVDGYQVNLGSSSNYFEVDDPYVIIRNSRFTTSGRVGNGSAMLQAPPQNKNLSIETSEFEGGRYFQRGVQADTSDLAITKSRFHNTGESAIEKNDTAARSSLTVTESYLSNDKGWPRAVHVDGIQVGGAKNITIRHNTVLNQPFGGAQGDTSYISNSALGLWAELGNVSGTVVVDQNLLAGGGRTIYIEQKGSFRWQGPVKVTNNTFDTRFGKNASVWGPLAVTGLPSNLTWTGNRFSDGRAISLQAAVFSFP